MRYLQQPRDLRQGEVTRGAEYDRSVGVRQRVYEGLNNKITIIDIDIILHSIFTILFNNYKNMLKFSVYIMFVLIKCWLISSDNVNQ